MNITKKEYAELVEKASPPSPKLKNCIWAFLVGGSICTIGQLFFEFLKRNGIDEKQGYATVSITIIALTAIFTGLGLFDKLAKHAGAGTLVPVTGFANSVASPAIEFKSEGFVLGMAAKMFIISVPVIVYGTVASVIYGIIYWVTTLC